VAAAAKLALAALVALAAVPSAASAKEGQEGKPVPKGSQRVSIPGCAKGYVFTTVARREDQPGSVNMPEGTHIRMNGKKDLIKEIDAHRPSVVVITGLMKEGQYAGPTGRFGFGNPLANQLTIDVEGWRPGLGECPS